VVAQATRNILEIKDLNKTFGGLAAVRNVTAYIKEGEILGMIGPNGAGKTTLFNLISGAYVPNSGSIIFEGEHIEGKADYQISRKGICRTYQIVKPFNNLTVLENVLVGAFKKNDKMKLAKEFSLDLLNLIGLYEKRDHLASSLTLAEKKSLEVARALATHPKLILLDEVMAGLTPKEQSDSIKLIFEINQKGITLLVIEHKMKIIMSISNRIIVLHYGEKIAEGSPEEVSGHPKVIEAYLGEKNSLA
jgi:branched-chain amino acid transport system ATP-binding protein